MMHTRFSSIGLGFMALFAGLFMGCSTAEGGADEGSGGSTAGSGGAASGGNGSGSGGAPSGGSSGTGGSPSGGADISVPLPGPWGKVLFFYSAAGEITTVGFRSQAVDEYAECETIEQTGACTLRDCPLVLDSGNFGGPTVGTVARGGEVLSTMPVGGDSAEIFPALQAGDEVSVTAEGADFPGYTARVVFPGTFTLLAPAVTAGAVGVASTEDLELSWEGGGESTISFQAYGATDEGDREKSLLCFFEPGATSGVVPASMLAAVAGIYDGSLYSMQAVDVVAGDMTVQVRTASSVFAPGGGSVDFNIE